jgi:hypothetical protein
MSADLATLEQADPVAYRLYRDAMRALQGVGVPFLVGGAYAFGHYTGLTRHTKDFDLFVRPRDVGESLDTLAAEGWRTEVVFSHWLAKAHQGEHFIDVIFCSGNGLCAVDDAWRAHAARATVLGLEVRLVPAEEMIWQKAFIMERERFDGADVLHLLRACGPRLDWPRLLARFGADWRVLLSHLVLFGYVYPDDGDKVPADVVTALAARLAEGPGGGGAAPLCRGPLLSRTQYLADVERWGYADPRRRPLGPLSGEQVARWDDAGRPPGGP